MKRQQDAAKAPTPQQPTEIPRSYALPTDCQFVELKDGRPITTSLKVAEVFGKKHFHVVRDIQDLECSEDFRASNFGWSSYTSPQNKKIGMYELTRDGFVFLCMGFTGKKASQFKEQYIAEFNRMEAALRNPVDSGYGAQRSADLASPAIEQAISNLRAAIEVDIKAKLLEALK